MENKYYTPKIEQFVVGFKYELQDDKGSWLWSNAPQDKKLLEKLIKDGRCRALAMNANTKLSERPQSADKLIFIYEAIKNRKEIAAHIFNDVFCEFEDAFYKGKPYKNAMANFKKYMKLASENKGHRVVVLPAKNNGIVHGIKNLWSIEYCNTKLKSIK